MRTSYYFSVLAPLFVFLLVVTSNSRPHTAPVRHTDPQRYTQSARNGAAPPPGFPRPTIFPQTIAYDFPNKRMMPGFTPTVTRLKRVHFQTLTAMVPVTAPAKFLEDFFRSIAIKADPATGEWGSQLPQRDAFDIVEGVFRLRFSSVGDTIPWSFVKSFADRLWECAVMGVADLFETVYFDDMAKIGVQITLTLFDESSVASGSVSGSDPGNYREGSWESITSPGGGS